MSDIESANFSETAAGNNAASPNGAPEGMAPSGVNDTIREIMAAIKRDWNRSHPTVTSGGGANAQTLTYGAAPAGYFPGQRFCFIAGFSNTGAATLNVNGLGAKAIQLAAAALTGGEILAGQMVTVAYDGTQFQITALPGHYRGGLIGIQTFGTAGSFTYTPTVGTNSVVVELVGGGGGGGGCALTGASQVAMGAAGGGGGHATKRITTSFSGVTVAVGAKGTGGAAGANNGSAGGTTSFGALLSATGGTGGNGGAAQGTPTAVFGGGAGTGSSGAPNGVGGAGGPSIAPNSTVVAAGGGGSSFSAQEVRRRTTAGAAGNNAITPGGGGSGANNTQSQGTGLAGGSGAEALSAFSNSTDTKYSSTPFPKSQLSAAGSCISDRLLSRIRVTFSIIT